MKLKARGLVSAVLTAAVAGQAVFVRAAGPSGVARQSRTSDAARIARPETLLEGLRQELKIPAYSAAVVKDQKVLWAKGFGYADAENKVPATEHTPYHLASLTKTFASTILMRLVQEGKLKLDDPVSKYGVLLEGDGVIRVRHLLSHTSEGSPGERYRYNGNRFAELDKVVQRAGGKSFAELLIADVLEPLGMNDTAPNVPRMVGTRTPGAADAAAEGEVKAAVLEIMAGFTSGDVSRIERRLAPHHNVFQGEEGFLTSFIDAAELSRAFQSGFKLQFEVRELEAAVYGDTAAATFFVSGTSTPPGGAPRAGGPWRSSFVLNRHEGGWKLVHSHQSPINRTTITEKHRQRFDAGKNRQADVVITLPAGNYRLRYKSDDSHAFGRWNSLPPDINFWGIAVYKK